MKMPELMKKKWLAALRSGEYDQGQGRLCTVDNTAYCCLGVLQMVCDKDVQRWSDSGESMGMPTPEWWESHGVKDTAVSTRGTTLPHQLSAMNDGDSAEGKAVLTMGDVDSSNTGIPGACDVLLGVGATDEQKRTGIRVLSMSKNKIGGVHDDFPVRFNPFLSKYISIKDND